MITRRNFIVAAAAITAAAPLDAAFAQTDDQIEALFVQSAKGMSFDKTTGKLTLQGIGPATIVFSDRPQRIAGHMDCPVINSPTR